MDKLDNLLIEEKAPKSYGCALTITGSLLGGIMTMIYFISISGEFWGALFGCGLGALLGGAAGYKFGEILQGYHYPTSFLLGAGIGFFYAHELMGMELLIKIVVAVIGGLFGILVFSIAKFLTSSEG